MNSGGKIPKRLAPEPIDKPWSGGKVWRIAEIIAESAEAAEGLNGLRPAVSIFGHENCSLEPSAQRRRTQRDL